MVVIGLLLFALLCGGIGVVVGVLLVDSEVEEEPPGDRVAEVALWVASEELERKERIREAFWQARATLDDAAQQAAADNERPYRP